MRRSSPWLREYPPALLLLACVAMSATPAWPQSAASRGSISGMVVDPHGDRIPGATITIRNTDLASVRSLAADPEGHFVATFLSAGPYLVQVSASGFTLKKPARVTLNAGSSVQITVQMAVAATSETVTVKGRGATVEGNTVQAASNRTEPSLANSLAGLTVTYLPNRDRDFSQFGVLAAGVETSPDDSGLVIAGQRPDFTAAAIDGADFQDPLVGGQRGSRDQSFFFPQTVVREFQIVRAGASSEVGGTNAGFLNVVTKEGSNKYKGEAFYIGRPPLSSADAFGHTLDNTQNEFGGSVGGPIRKDRSFFYAGAEQNYVNRPYWTEFEPQAPGVTVPFGLSALQGQVRGKSDPTAVFARTDFLLNAANTLNVQFNWNRLNASGLDSNSTRSIAAPENNFGLTGNSYWVRGTLTTLFGSNVVSQALLQWLRDDRNFVPSSTAPESVINGFGILGGNSLYPNIYSSNSTRFSEDVAVIDRDVVLHFGASFAYNPANEIHEANQNGRFDFDSLNDYLAGSIRRYQQTFLNGDARYSGAVRQLGLYVNGKFPVGSKLTLTAGVRWDGQWNPQPNRPNPAIPLTTYVPNDLSQWQPRLGLAWAVSTNTVVRASAGTYDAPTPATYFQRVFTDNALNTTTVDSYYDPQVLGLVGANGMRALTSVPSGLAVPAAYVEGIAPSFRNPRSFQAAASIERQVTSKVTITAGYVRNSTWDLQTRLNQNLFAPTYDAAGMPIFPSERPDPAIGQLFVNESSAHSSYDAMQVTASFQLPKRSQLAANYTLARNRDNDSNLGPFTLVSPLNPFDLSSNAAYSAFDVRNNFNLSAITNLPHGFKLNPVVLVRSGMPYTPVIGLDTQNDGNDWNDRAILNGTVAPRNILRQPSFFNLDLRVVKDFALHGEGRHLDLFMDLFNITGASNKNFGPESISLFGTPAAPIFSAGQPLFAPAVSEFGSARQVQFTVRITAF